MENAIIENNTINMRKLFFMILGFISITLSTTSCTKDYSNPENLVGTTWRCDSLYDVEYLDLRFVSISDVELWTTYFGDNTPEKDGTYTYAVSDNSISIVDDEGNEFLAGEINGKDLELYANGVKFIFEKE